MIDPVSKLRRWLRPGINDTETGRSQERNRRAIITTGTSLFVRSSGLIFTLVVIPLALGALGKERFGIWMTITSFSFLFMFADLGIGNGLIYAVSSASAEEDREKIARYLSSALALLGSMAVLLALVITPLIFLFPLSDLLSATSPEARREVGPAVIIFAFAFLLTLPLVTAKQTRLGFQEGYINNMVESAGILIRIAGVLLAIFMGAGLPWIILAFMLGPFLASAGNLLHLVRVSRPWLGPGLGNVGLEPVKTLLKTGALFFLLQVSVSLSNVSDNVIISYTVSPSTVSDYAVARKLFDFFNYFVTILVLPLWPAYGEATVRGDFAWVRKTFTRSLLAVTGLSTAVNLALVWAGPWIIHVWMGPQIDAPRELLLPLAVWTTLLAMGNCVAMYLNGTNNLSLQAFFGLLMGVVSVFVKIHASSRYGITTLAWTNSLTYFVLCLLPITVYAILLVRRDRPGGPG